MENSVTGKDMVYYLIDSFNAIWDSTVAFVHELYNRGSFTSITLFFHSHISPIFSTGPLSVKRVRFKVCEHSKIAPCLPCEHWAEWNNGVMQQQQISACCKRLLMC